MPFSLRTQRKQTKGIGWIPPLPDIRVIALKASRFRQPEKRLCIPLFKHGGLRQFLQTFVGHNFMSPNIHVFFRSYEAIINEFVKSSIQLHVKCDFIFYNTSFTLHINIIT